MKTAKNFQEIMEAYINMHIDESFNIEIGTNVSMKSGGKNIYGKVIGKEKVMGEPGVEVKWDSGTKGRFKMSDFSSLSMDKKADYIISESVEQIDEAIKIGTKVKIHTPGKHEHNKVGVVREIRHGLFKGAPKEYTVEYDYDRTTGDSQSIQLPKKNVKMYKEESVEQIDEVKSMFSQTDRELFAKMTPEEKKERYQHILKLTKHSDSQIRDFAKYAAKEFKQKYMNETVEDIDETLMMDVRKEVEKMLGKKLEGKMLAKFNTLRKVGYANPQDIVRELKESFVTENFKHGGIIEESRTQLAEQFARMTMERNFARSTGNPWTFRNEKEREYTRLKLQLEKLESDT